MKSSSQKTYKLIIPNIKNISAEELAGIEESLPKEDRLFLTKKGMEILLETETPHKAEFIMNLLINYKRGK